MVDYLVVGLGLAGVSICHILERENKSFKVIANGSQGSSWVAGGLYNPVVLKRFNAAWHAKEQLTLLKPFYASLEEKLQIRLDYPMPVLRRFASPKEQNMWFEAADRPELKSFLDLELKPNSNPAIDAPLGFGSVTGTGRIDTRALVEHYQEHLWKSGFLIREKFDYSALEPERDEVIYGRLRAKRIVFATGIGLRENPYFNYLPLQGTKGELLTIKAPQLKEHSVIKSSVFIIPLGDDLYRVGATYNWKDNSNEPTREAREELLDKLHSFLRCDYELLDQIAGIRPTVA
ncbi:MAG: NAD(P)/FAD-dependent oxidoreductase, partial [Flavobacteriaceae bacterium]